MEGTHLVCLFCFINKKTQSYKTVMEGTQKCVPFLFCRNITTSGRGWRPRHPAKKRYRFSERYYLQSLIPSLRINAPCHPSRCDSVTVRLWNSAGVPFTTSPPLRYPQERAKICFAYRTTSSVSAATFIFIFM